MAHYIVGLADLASCDVGVVGGKACGLSRLADAGFSVPEAVVLTTKAYADVVGQLEIPDLRDEGTAIDDRASAASRAFADVGLPPGLEAEVRSQASRLLAGGRTIAVRSSATLEDSPDTSFAGMLDTVTDVATVDEAVDAVRTCWASAFQPRVSHYLIESGIDPNTLAVAVVLQRQIEAERSGLVFSRDPVNRYSSGVVVEAICGLGEDLVSGEATPERYRHSADTGRVTVTTLSTQSGGPDSPADVEFHEGERRLTDPEVAQLAEWAREAERVFGAPQDIEWAFADGRFWLLQSRPLIFAEREERLFPQIAEHTVLASGVGVSPSVGSGRVRVFGPAAGPSGGLAGVVAVLPRLTNDLAVRLRDAAGVVADEGGATSHGANILREFAVPCVIGTGGGTRDLDDGRTVTVDGYRGLVFEGDLSLASIEPHDVPETETKVFCSVLVPDRAAAVAPHADGVSSLRDDYFLMDTGVHPARLVRDGLGEDLRRTLAAGIVRTCELFAGRPVWFKTMDAPSDEFRRLAGGSDEPAERNPLLGWRGIGRELGEEEMLHLELGAVADALDAGAIGLGVKLPFMRFAEEYLLAERAMREHGIEPHVDCGLGVSVEIPATAMRLGDLLDLGADFVSVGLSDLTMCTLAIDRESRHVADLFDPAHPAVVELLYRIAEECSVRGAFTCVCGESARDPRVLPLLVELGFDAVGVSLSYFGETKCRLAEVEARRRPPATAVRPQPSPRPWSSR